MEGGSEWKEGVERDQEDLVKNGAGVNLFPGMLVNFELLMMQSYFNSNLKHKMVLCG